MAIKEKTIRATVPNTAIRRCVVFSGSLINETDLHDITEILVKVALNTTTHNRIFVESA
jgi:hypothetical protein